MSYAGMDATDIFEAFHDSSSYKLLPSFYIGDVRDYKVSESLLSHRNMKELLKQENLYDASSLYYVYKFLSNVTLLSLSIFVAANYESSWRILISGILMALFWQQCGWLAHDFLHHQVFKTRKWNNYMGYLVGNVFQGFSCCWWKSKHNLHHATPNVAGFDPDIDTMPLLTWSEKLIDGEVDGLPSFLLKYQYIVYVPLLSAARLSWLIQSFLYAKSKAPKTKQFPEVFWLVVHYTWYLAVMICYMSFTESLLFFLTSQAFTGLFLAAAFSLNHNGMIIYKSGIQGEMDFNKLQVSTGRDVTGAFAGWFMGGLNFQIEHHLFPRVPRHNLPKVQRLVVPACAKYGITYHITDFWVGTKETFAKLYSVSSVAQKKMDWQKDKN